jgi:hypothetical protein
MGQFSCLFSSDTKINYFRNFVIYTLHKILLGSKKSKRMRWAGNVANTWEMRNTYKIFIGKGKR